MKYFRRIREGVDVAPLLAEIRAHEDAWTLDTSRQEKIRVQKDTNTIFLRGPVSRPDLNVNENQESRLTGVAKLFPRALEFMNGVARERGGELARAAIVRLKPLSRVARHIDIGSYYLIRDRFHLVLESAAGSVLMSGGEQVRMHAGELWWFDNRQHHEAYNESEQWRIHYIFDVLPEAHKHLAVNAAALPAEDKPPPVRPVEALARAIGERGILRGEHRRLISPAGANQRWLIDLRRVFLDAEMLEAFAKLFWESCAGVLPFQVGAMETAAIPLLSAILLKGAARGTPVNGFIVRKERKTHGAGALIEGELNDAPIVMVDDIFHSGASMEKARVVLEEWKKTIALAFVAIDYRSARGQAWQDRHGIAVCAPFTLADFGLSLEAAPARAMARFENRWNFAAPDPNFFHRVPKSFPATDGRRVYFGSDAGTFYALNAGDGSVAWTFGVNARGHKNLWSAPALHDGTVYFGSYDGNVYALDAETGIEKWRFTGADWVGSSPALAEELGLLFIGLEFAVEGKRGSIAALRMDTGEKVWEHGTRRYTHASPAYWPERRLVACGSNDNELFLFEARTGAMVWRFETEGSIRHAPAFDRKRGHVITGCADGRIYVIDAATGEQVWGVATDNTIYTIPLIVGDAAWVGSTDKYLYVLDLERRVVRKKIYAGAKIFSPPRFLEGRVYFGTCGGLIYELDAETDQVTGTHQLPDAVTNALSYNALTGDFYALTYVNQLFAFSRG